MLRPWKLEIRLNHTGEKAIYIQIADAIIADIQSGRLTSGTALPGSRSLAQLLNVNRNTVVEALNVLLNEGWLISQERKGAFVADILPSKVINHEKQQHAPAEKQEKYRINFDDGHPDTKIAPVAELARAYRQIFNRNARWQMMGYGCEFGHQAFRIAVAQMLNHQRGMQIETNSLCITRGSQMAMYLVAQCLLEKGDYVIVEDPGYKPAWQTFELAGARLLYVGVDNEGLITDDVIRHLKTRKKIKAIYTTPHHQYPTTVTMSLQRRQELIRLSNEYNFTIIEDDYDNEFHFGYRPVLPLCSSPELQQAIYIGTMSKVVAPALRIGYVASKDVALIEKIGALRKLIDVQGDNIMEQAVLQLINDGTIKKHIKKATQHYKSKRDFTYAMLNRYLADKATYVLPEGGLAFWVIPHQTVDWSKLLSKGIKLLTHYSKDDRHNGIRLSYGSLSEEHLTEGIRMIAKLLD